LSTPTTKTITSKHQLKTTSATHKHYDNRIKAHGYFYITNINCAAEIYHETGKKEQETTEDYDYYGTINDTTFIAYQYSNSALRE